MDHTLLQTLRESVPPEEEGQLLLPVSPKKFFTDEELAKIKNRPFQYRLFFTSTILDDVEEEGETVFLRNRFSDDADHDSSFVCIRDLVWADATNDKVLAMVTLTNCITTFIRMDEGIYYSFASLLASALSQRANNAVFQSDQFMTYETLEFRRERFVLLMQTVFSAVAKDRFLLRDGNVNIYRLAFCLLHSGGKHNRVWIPVLLSVSLQFTLMAYVCAELVVSRKKWEFIWANFPLALLATLYSMIQAWKGLKSVVAVRDTLYVGRSSARSCLLTIDVLVNFLIPLVAVALGFIIIVVKEGFIEGVLNTAALLFISEIDDQLPEFLEYSNEDVVRTFVIQNATKEYDDLLVLEKKTYGHCTQAAMLQKGDIEYSDIMITDSGEAGMDPLANKFFGPIDAFCYSILAIIQPGCLLKEVSWLYQYEVENEGARDKMSRGNVVYLKLVTLGDEKVIKIENPKFTGDLNLDTAKLNTIKGVYMLTSFKKTQSVVNLRVCGSSTGKQFKSAMEYYNLWGISAEASDLLESPMCNPTKEPTKSVTTYVNQETCDIEEGPASS